jgi:hypothetical protein
LRRLAGAWPPPGQIKIKIAAQARLAKLKKKGRRHNKLRKKLTN